MRKTVIYTVKQTLTIDTPERIKLEQMGLGGRSHVLRDLPRGTHDVPVDDGVYMVLSNGSITVTSTTQDPTEFHLAAIDNKDGPPPDPPRMKITFDTAAIKSFIGFARDIPPPT